MKNFQTIVCAGILAIALSVPALAKSGTISTTKTGTISTTRTGTISTTRTGTISTTTVGTISTTRTGLVPATISQSMFGSDGFLLTQLLLSVFSLW